MELLNDMALFVEVAQARSFRRAADVAGVPSSTLSRRISTLEKAIGLRLLHRTTRKVELTEAGQSLAPQLTAGFNHIFDAVNTILQERS